MIAVQQQAEGCIQLYIDTKSHAGTKKTFSSNAFLLKAQEGEEHAMRMVAYINSTI
jgi:ferritin